jgi:hypothetical protein
LISLYVAAKRIYEREAQWRHVNASEQLLSGKEVIDSFFENFEHHLSFLRNLPKVRNYVLNQFRNQPERNEIEHIFLNIALEKDVRKQLTNLDLSFGKRKGQYMVSDTVTI